MNELTTMAASLGTLLKERKETIAVAESSAGGLISTALLAVPGASAYFLGGGVIYTQAARRALLGVPDESVRGIRASTEAYALLKARTVRELLGATWGLAETGASGPTGNGYGGPVRVPRNAAQPRAWSRPRLLRPRSSMHDGRSRAAERQSPAHRHSLAAAPRPHPGGAE